VRPGRWRCGSYLRPLGCVRGGAGFSLEGRPIRKVRQSVTRLSKAGYEAEAHDLRALDQDTIERLEEVVEIGRQGAPERGFSMAMDSIRGACEQDTLFVLARDDFGKYLALGVTVSIVVQALINMSVVLDLAPTKGFPLPMISFGGSSMLSTLASLGMLLSVSENEG